MIINDLLKNPLVKLVGIGAILYFALFSDEKNPQNLGNKLKKDNLKSGFEQVSEKKNEIISALIYHKPYVSPKDFISCGDEVGISDQIQNQKGEITNQALLVSVKIGNNSELFYEKNAFGMKFGEEKNVIDGQNQSHRIKIISIKKADKKTDCEYDQKRQ